MSEPQRTLELACFLRVALLETTDLILSLCDLRVTDLRRHAQRRAREGEYDELAAIRAGLSHLHEMATDKQLSDTAFRQYFLEHMPVPNLGYRSRAQRVREALADDRIRVRRLLEQILAPRTITRTDSTINRQLHQWIDLHTQRTRKLPDDLDLEAPRSWKPLLAGADRKRALHAFDCVVLLAVQRALRNGSMWAPHSLSFLSRNAMFIDETQWKSERQQHYRALGIPRSVTAYLKPRLALLKAGIASVTEAVAHREITIDHQGVHLDRLVGQDEDQAVTLARKRLFDAIGPVQLPVIIVDIDREVRFSWKLLGRPPRDRRELLTLYGAVLAHGTDMNAASVSMMMPEISESAIAEAMHQLERENLLREANDLVVGFMRRHTVVQHWGSGENASSDGMSLDASRQLWNARVDPRRRTYGVGIYQHLLDQWGVIYDQPIVLGTRQAGAAIEGAVRQTAVGPIERVTVDTHGYTDYAMGLARLLGFDLCPRLKDLRDRKLHVPVGFSIPPAISSIVRDDIRLSQLDDYWDDQVRIAASVKTGYTTANMVLQRYGSAARGDPVHRAGTALGQLERSLFLCDVLTSPPFRRELSRTLAHGESFHTLQRVIHFGSIGVARGRRREELVAISGSLTLLTNLVMAWNTHQMQRVLDRWKRKGLNIEPEIVRHIAPTHYRHINFRGEFEFPIEDATHRLLSQQAVVG